MGTLDEAYNGSPFESITSVTIDDALDYSYDGAPFVAVTSVTPPSESEPVTAYFIITS